MSARYAINFNKHGEGFVVNEEAGETLGLHKLVYRTAAESWNLADADTVATMPVLGITMGAISTGKKGWILLWGYIGDTVTWAWTQGGEIYASAVAGELTQTMPAGVGDIVQVVAVAATDDIIQFIGTAGAAIGGSNTLEGETAFVGVDPSKDQYVNYWYCDGVADDVQIQAATTYVSGLGGGVIFIEAGDYDITATITVPSYTRYHIVGELTLADNTDADMFDLDAGAQYIEFYGGSIQGNKTNQASGSGINASDSDYVWIHDMRIERFKDDGILVVTNPSTALYVNDNWINQNENNGINGSALADALIINNHIGNSGLHGVLLGGNTNIVSDNHIWVNTEDGINCSGDQNVITGNRVNTNGRSGIGVVGSTGGVVNDNFIKNNGQGGFAVDTETGVRLNTCSNIVVDGNFILDDSSGAETQRYGVHIYAASNCVVSNNVIKNHVTDGIELDDDSNDNQILANQLIDNGSYGIDVNAAACDNNVVKDNKFSGNATAAINDGGTDTAVPEIPIYVKDPDGAIGTHPALLLPDGADITIYDQIQMPLEFQELVSAEIIIVPAAAGNMRRSAASNWGKIGSGEAYNAQTDTIAAGQVAVDADDLEAIDISTLFTAIAAGDQIGFTFTREGSDVNDTVNADCYYLGGRIRYV